MTATASVLKQDPNTQKVQKNNKDKNTICKFFG